MRISNCTEFNNFIKSNGFSSLDTAFGQLDYCLTKYAHKCNCYKKEDKIQQYQNCISIYRKITSQVMPRLKIKILQQTGNRNIQFYENNKIIGSIGY